jgi:5-methyltetrahydrofolate--homocysteine methyltransferase
MSALLTTTMAAMGRVVAELKENGLAVKTIVGGAAVSDEFARRIGADGYGCDAARAVEIVGIWLP